MEISTTTLKLYTRIDQIKNTIGRVLAPAAGELGVSPMQLFLLLQLACSGSATVGSLSRELNMNAGNVSTQCKRLEGRGLLTRTRSQTDERVVNLELTAAGQDAVTKFQRVLDLCGTTLDSLPQEKKDVIFAGLDALDEVINGLARSLGQQ